MIYSTPQGFRDILPDESLRREVLVRRLQDLFAEAGYAPIETPTLEVMAVADAGGRMPASPFRLFDASGTLLAMRPDVTSQIARVCATRLAAQDGPVRLRYTQRVFREAKNPFRADPREETQIGIECVGPSGAAVDAEVVVLAARALELCGVGEFTIAVASVGVLRRLLESCGAPEPWRRAVLEAYHASDLVEVDRLCSDAACVAPVYGSAIASLARIRGGRGAVAEAEALAGPLGCAGCLAELKSLVDELDRRGLGERLLVDFSIMSSFDYYTGFVFEVFAPARADALARGGRYDNMLGSYGASRPAAGFALGLEACMEAAEQQGAPTSGEARPLRVAVPKGSLNADAIAVLAGAGLDVSGLAHPGRSLIIRNRGVEYLIVRPSDAPALVALGAADCGICGLDSLLETDASVVQLADLRFGACRFIVAEPAGTSDEVRERYERHGSVRVATKYPRIAQRYYEGRCMKCDIVALHGNIELAPLTGLAEQIVDITATGATLRENNLVIVDDVLSSTARFFANGSALRTDERIGELAARLSDFAATQPFEPIAGSTN